MRMITILLAAVTAGLASAGPALAVELKSTDITQDGKRVTLHLRFSAAPEYETVAHYAKNQLILHVTGLTLTKSQLKNGIAIKGGLREAVNGAALALPKDQPFGEIRLQLEKGFTPGDAQVIPRESVIDIEFIVSKAAAGGKPADKPQPASKPSADPAQPAADGWQPPPAEDEPLTTLTGQRFDAPLTIAASVGSEDAVHITDDDPAATEEQLPSVPLDSAAAAASSGFEADPAEPADAGAPTEPAQAEPLDKPFTVDELAQFSGMESTPAPAEAVDGQASEVAGPEPAASPAAAAASAAAEPQAETEPVAANLDTALEEAGGLAIEPASSDPPPSAARTAPAAGPSYLERDLDEVAVNQREYRNLPFREAILDLVAGTGFNVVVGPGIDNETVYLNFKQKELSLKSALDTLCAVYGLSYDVTDDAITISQA